MMKASPSPKCNTMKLSSLCCFLFSKSFSEQRKEGSWLKKLKHELSPSEKKKTQCENKNWLIPFAFWKALLSNRRWWKNITIWTLHFYEGNLRRKNMWYRPPNLTVTLSPFSEIILTATPPVPRYSLIQNLVLAIHQFQFYHAV